MNEVNEPGQDLVCGVKRPLVEGFLMLIRDYYRMADKASFFLESQAGLQSPASIRNLRDVLSHLATMLDPMTPEDAKCKQLAAAEEHLRRAIIEPYKIALPQLMAAFDKLCKEYKKKVIPSRNVYGSLANAPTIPVITECVREIGELIERGRDVSFGGGLGAEFEHGVAAYAKAYDMLMTLKSQLEKYVYVYETAVGTSWRWRRLRAALVASLVGAFVAVGVSLLAAIASIKVFPRTHAVSMAIAIALGVTGYVAYAVFARQRTKKESLEEDLSRSEPALFQKIEKSVQLLLKEESEGNGR